jgi:DNA processing protein
MYKKTLSVQDQEEILNVLTITFMPGIGDRTARKLLSVYESATRFWAEHSAHKISGLKPGDFSTASISAARSKAEFEMRFMEKHGIHAFAITEKDYPHRLRGCEDGPVLIFTRGNMELNASRMIAIVGTRKSTEYGRIQCEMLVEELAHYNCSLISGLAYGIDGHAHRSASKQGIQNIAVLAHGLDRVYPTSHEGLARKMLECGGLISDFPCGTKPDRENFPKRNRIVAGLADAVIVVEAAKKGGALITADIASSYNRDVFAIPGRTEDEFSKGCNDLIKYNKAALLGSADDLAWYMGWKQKEEKPKSVQASLIFDFSVEEEKLVTLIRNRVDDLDNLSVNAGLPISKTSATLLELEFKGVLRTLPGKRYELLK